MKSNTTNNKKKEIIEQSTRDFQNLNEDSQMFILGYMVGIQQVRQKEKENSPETEKEKTKK